MKKIDPNKLYPYKTGQGMMEVTEQEEDGNIVRIKEKKRPATVHRVDTPKKAGSVIKMNTYTRIIKDDIVGF